MKTKNRSCDGSRVKTSRRGSTLVIVISLLGLLAFTGMVFYTFAAQERIASEYFSEAAKAQYSEPSRVWPHMLEQIIVGPSERYRGSKLYGSTRRHSMVRNMVGSDIYPYNADGFTVEYDVNGFPEITSSVTADSDGVSYLDFVDSPAAGRASLVREAPEPDVDYTYPDLNNLFLAYNGWAIRENGDGSFTQVRVIIPSLFRPQYMRQDVGTAVSTGATRDFGFGPVEARTNPEWAYAYTPGSPPTAVDITDANRDTVLFQQRSFRPHPADIAGVTDNGTVSLRYITSDEATTLSLGAGGFPFLPEDLNGNGLNGDLGIWTITNDPSKPAAQQFDDLTYELDTDNDGDGIREGIWLDLHFPVQEFTDGAGDVRKYVVLHSVTIYDLDGLFNLNVHGNLAGLRRTGTLPEAVTAGDFSSNYVSRSHHGLGPNEVNPIWGLRRDTALDPSVAAHMGKHFGGAATNPLEQGNAEWAWLLMGRVEYGFDGTALTDLTNLHGGRWGDKNLLYNALEVAATPLRISEMPRPGRAGNVYRTISSGPSFGGRDGIDDNQNADEGEGYIELVDDDGDPMTPAIAVVYKRPFGQPVSWSGAGRRTQVDEPVFNPTTQRFEFNAGDEFFGTDNPLRPILLRDETSPGSAQWAGFFQYGASSSMDAAPVRFSFGPDETYGGSNAAFQPSGAGDDLNYNPVFDELIEDPLETIFDHDRADRTADGVAAIADLVRLQWPTSSEISSTSDPVQDTEISEHLENLAPHAFAAASDRRKLFTTLSNSLRYIAMQRSARRPWEYTADSDGNDNDDDGFPDGDGNFEFPPVFGTVQEFTAADPFRPQVRRLLTNEAGENRDLIGALPLSINHILDVDRTDDTPAAGTAQFLRYMQRSGLRFRPVTEHPHVSNIDATNGDAIDVAALITLEVSADSDTNTVASEADVRYPPEKFSEQEFWARRDRQQLARDIYVLLYTLGGAEQTGANIRDYTGDNSGFALYSHEQLRRMAQFAVNMVDAMDTDNVITKFEYDKNLGDGWNLDDDAFSEESAPVTTPAVTARGMYPEDSLTRGVVFGVEAQELAFSEVQGITNPEITAANHNATPHDDTAGERHHLFVELRNMRPQTIDLGTAASLNELTGIFRLARFDRTDPNDDLQPAAGPTAAITFHESAGAISGGDRFTVATASDSSLGASDFYFDYDLDGTLNLITPDVTPPVTIDTGVGLCDLDLIDTNHSTRFTLTDSSQAVTTTAGAFLDSLQTYQGTQAMIDLRTNAPQAGGVFGSDGRNGFDLVIQRRLNPHLPSLANTTGQSVDVNPWVEVDRIRVLFDETGLVTSDVAADLPGRLVDVRSFERDEPLNDNSRNRYPLPATVTDNRNNSIGADFNTTSLTDPTQPFNATTNTVVLEQAWQPHFDRDFTSAGELLALPIFGPNLTTQRLSYSRLTPEQQLASGTLSLSNASGASALFLRPDFDPTTTTNTENDNRWYRLFQFVEVPSRVHRMLGNYLTQDRLPGKINLNTIRHLEVFAGLVDDPFFADIDGNRDRSPFLRDSTPGLPAADGENDRWIRFMRDRDGAAVEGYYDPTPATSGDGDEASAFLIPGVPGSQPFRTFGHQNESLDDNGIDQTILRASSLGAGDAADNRRWLEVGTAGNHNSPAVASTQLERHQLLTKIMNNTTTVSNCFVVFATAGYFEAIEDANGFVRVGGRLNINTGDPVTASNAADSGSRQRAVFVIDRSEAFNAYDAASGDFDWERMVKYQADIGN